MRKHGVQSGNGYQRVFLLDFAQKFGIRNWEDWYLVSKDKVVKGGGRFLLNHYSNSVHKMVCSIFPEHEWLEWKFGNVSSGFWEQQSNRLKYIRWLSRQLGFRTKEDLYKLTIETFRKHSGRFLLESFGNSPIRFLRSIFPDHAWIPWKMNKAPHNFWSKEENVKSYVDWLGKELGFIDMEDWYNLTYSTISQYGGQGLLGLKEGSPIAILKMVFPSHKWLPWKFGKVPVGFWDLEENQKLFIEWLAEELNIKRLDEWYRISQPQVFQFASAVPLKTKGLANLLMSAYPNHNWDYEKLVSSQRAVKASQRHLVQLLQDFFPDSGKDFDP